ncbi:MAG: hypothetical protein ACXVBV_21760, partial [Isosphaeraceae bacterium]
MFDIQPGSDGRAAFVYGIMDPAWPRKILRSLAPSRVALFDWKSQRLLGQLPERPDENPQSIAFCRGGRTLAVNYLGKTGRESVVLFDAGTLTPTGEFYPVAEGAISRMEALSPDGSILAVAFAGEEGQSGVLFLDLERKLRLPFAVDGQSGHASGDRARSVERPASGVVNERVDAAVI